MMTPQIERLEVEVRASVKYPIKRLEVGEGFRVSIDKTKSLRSLATRYGSRLGREFQVTTIESKGGPMAYMHRVK